MDISKTYDKREASDVDIDDSSEWAEVGDGTAEVLVRPLHHPKVQAGRNRILRTRGRMLRSGKLSAQKVHEIWARWVAECVVEDWRGVSNGKAEITFAVDTAFGLFRDHPDFASDVLQHSTAISEERIAALEEAGEALGKSSG